MGIGVGVEVEVGVGVGVGVGMGVGWGNREQREDCCPQDTPTCPSLLILTGLLSFQGFLRSWQLLKSRGPLTE